MIIILNPDNVKPAIFVSSVNINSILEFNNKCNITPANVFYCGAIESVEDNGMSPPDDVISEDYDSLNMLLADTFSRQLKAHKMVQNTPGVCFTFIFPIEMD